MSENQEVIEGKRVAFKQQKAILKQQIINEYNSGKTSFRMLAKKYGISKTVINEWVSEHNNGDPLKSRYLKKVFKNMDFSDSQTQDLEQLRLAYNKLKAAYEYQHLRTTSLECMIELAEKTLNVEIRKKPGAKQ